MTERVTMIRVKRDAQGNLRVDDWRGVEHTVRPAELGALVERILADPELPDVQVVSPGVGRIADLIAHRLPPEDRDIVVPGMHGVALLFAALQRVRASRASTSAAPPPPPPPPPPRPEPEPTYRRPTYRRGQRFG